MSKSLPFLPRPEKLDGSMAGDVGFDPMGLSEIQQDLTYARWAELKHGRIAMLAIVGLITQEYFHLPGEAYQNPDPFGAISTVGMGVNAQIFAAIGVVELSNFDKHYDGSEPGDIGWTGSLLKGKSDEDIMKAKEQTFCVDKLEQLLFDLSEAIKNDDHERLIQIVSSVAHGVSDVKSSRDSFIYSS